MLKFEVPDLSPIDATLRDCYVKTEAGGYRLELDGYQTAEELRAGLAVEKAGAAAARAELNRLQKLAAESAQRQAAEMKEATQRQAERYAQLNAEYEQRYAQLLVEAAATQQARIASLKADLDRVTEDHAARDIAAELARRPEDGETLLPHVRERLQGRRDDNGKFSAAIRAEVAAQLLGDPAFAPIIRGASPQERALHAKRVAETLGVHAAQKPLTRKQFESQSPERRAESVRAGITILDG